MPGQSRIAGTLALLASLALLAGGCSRSEPGSDKAAAILLDSSDGDDWGAFGRTYGEQHFSPLTDINAQTVDRLGLAWSLDLPEGNSTSGPIAVGGVVYTATGYSVVHAIDAATGKVKWKYDPDVAGSPGGKIKMRNGWGIRGLAWWNGKVIVGTHDGRLIALDAASGKPVWTSKTMADDDVRFISGAPRVFNGKVIIGHGGADIGPTRGYVTAFDAENGKQLWRFYLVPGNPADGFEDEAQEMAAKTWTGEWWKFGGGGTVWNAITYDPETDTVFLGTGNGGPWNQKIRSPGGGDNLFLCSIVALDAKTGKYKWHYQVNPGETWDYNAAMDMPLATLTIDGKPRKVIMQAPKNGFFYVIDRITGKLISAEPFAKVSWASKIDLTTGRPVENPDARFKDGKSFHLQPSAEGAHNWLPTAFSPMTGLVYIPTLDIAADVTDKGVDLKAWRWVPGGINDNGMRGTLKPEYVGQSSLQAWDPVRQKQVWSVPTPGLWSGGAMATGGGLVFQGQADGSFVAYDAANGKSLWTFNAQSAVLAPPITYRAGGKQYVTVLSGHGSSGALFGAPATKFGWEARSQPRRVLTFVLDGKGTLPPRPAPYRPVALADPTYREDVTLGTAGMKIYHHHCFICHGIQGIAAGIAPDLRASAIPQSAEAFKSIVHDGALTGQGMPQYDQFTPAELDALRQYLRSASRDLAKEK